MTGPESVVGANEVYTLLIARSHNKIPESQRHTFTNLKFNIGHSETKHPLLNNFKRLHEIDIHFLQEVLRQNLGNIPGRKTIWNVSIDQRLRSIIIIKELEVLPKGRGITCQFNHITLVNINAPSGQRSVRSVNISLIWDWYTCFEISAWLYHRRGF